MTTAQQARLDQLRSEVSSVIRDEIAPALATHAGGLEITEVTGQTVRLQFTASCRSCYFRRGCIENLVEPELTTRLGHDVQFVVR